MNSIMSLSHQPQPYGATEQECPIIIPMTNKEKVENCRDFLRTGRCKYGASCKYYHPPNVQSGGGMKAPLDPSEPMFPIRPNEPVCQYYMKHGTCKFGQACKFHHPPASQQTQYAATGGSPLLLNMGQPRKIIEPATQLVAVGPPGSDLTHMMVQFLPQRPEEPDCIYFLKNGRCKYGATCRYHHPIHQPVAYAAAAAPPPQPTTAAGTTQARHRRHPRSNANDPYATASNRIHYANQVSAPPGQIVVATDGAPVSLVGTVDPNAATAMSYKPVTFVTAGGELITQGPYGTTAGTTATTLLSGSTVMTEQGSSASSIASSFDTASSGMDLTGADATTAQLWNRARKNGSGGSLNAFDKNRANGAKANLTSSASDGNIASRNHSNLGSSTMEHQARFDAADESSTDQHQSQASQRSASTTAWRNRSSSFDQQAKPRSLNGNGGDVTPTTENSSQGSGPSSGRPPMSSRSGRPRNSRGPGDEGFTMMTSALLNMLDTQEETAEVHSEDDGSYFTGTHYAQAEGGADGGGDEHVVQANDMLEKLTLGGAPPPGMVHPQEMMPQTTNTDAAAPYEPGNEGAYWSPTWNGAQPPPPQQPMPIHVIQHHEAHGPPSASHPTPATTSSDFGLYLP
mmetsp:Transcript_7842/g.17391  ORF Transcript_7842/g.17391 Transcript_7842/m.17391 type:complete len:628 (+) Transcript_7842:466-2349(+)